MALVPLVLVAALVAGGWTFTSMLGTVEVHVHRFAEEQRSARHDAERAAKTLADDLTETRTAKESAERGVAGLATELAHTRAALELAAQGEKEARSLLAREVRARESLAQAAKQAVDRLEQERAAREAAEKVARDAADRSGRAQAARAAGPADSCEPERRSRMLAEAELTRERSAKAAAEVAAGELRTQLAAFGSAPQGILALRDQLDTERRVRDAYERAAKDAQLQLVQEKYSHDATERTLKQAQERLAASSCWACPSGAPCSRPQ
jgi:dTMP kinase